MRSNADSHARSLAESVPDLTVLLGRNGTVLDTIGGAAVPALVPPTDSLGRSIAAIWPAPVAQVITRLLRHSLAGRCALEDVARHDRAYEVRVAPRGPAYALCTIRPALDLAGPAPAGHFDRRGFRRRFRESVVSAALKERPLAVAAIHLDGLAEIGDNLGHEVFEQVRDVALRRLDGLADSAPGLDWYVGPLDDRLWAAVIHSADRGTVQNWVLALLESLSAPVTYGDSTFRLSPHSGIAVLGKDGTSVDALIAQARSALEEARRSMPAGACFSSDTLRVRSLARLDMARELREAIDAGDVRLRYLSRHELATGSLVAKLAYLQWRHALRGEVRPAEFLRVAEATGQAVALSRSVLRQMAEDCASFVTCKDAAPRYSFGPLRHHVLESGFGDDIEKFLVASGLPPAQFELRIAERTYITCPSAVWERLAAMGVSLVIDECGRLHASLERMARSPLSGLQLDRSWVAKLPDPSAAKVCRAMIGLAHAFDLVPIAMGVDDEAKRLALLGLGCGQGSGDLFQAGASLRARALDATGVT